jgi:hypothetical protein
MKIQYKTIALDALFFCVGVGFRFIYIVRSSGCLGLGSKKTGISKEAEKHRSRKTEKKKKGSRTNKKKYKNKRNRKTTTQNIALPYTICMIIRMGVYGSFSHSRIH